jgi:hypothetical protein
MKRLLAGLIIGLVIAVAALAMVMLDALYSPAKAMLGRYMAYEAQFEPGLRVSETVYASRPANFTPEMSGRLFNGSTLLGVKDTPSAGDRTRYPPEQLVCVLLHSNQGDAVVFVALHTQLYYAQWLVHQATLPWPGEAMREQLAIVGCTFSH